jgi:hypothetical protein
MLVKANIQLHTLNFGAAIIKKKTHYKQLVRHNKPIALVHGSVVIPALRWIGTNANYLADNYVDVSPITRTNSFYTNPASGFTFPETTEERAATAKQEKFDSYYWSILLVGSRGN